MSHRNTVIDDLETVFSPAFPVNTDIETRRLAMIPGPAFSFVFCYGVKNFSAIEGVEDMYRNFDITFGPFSRNSQLPPPLDICTVCCALRSAPCVSDAD